ncbi:hypothetical protein AB0H36_42940 [Kribbella sp. NPDC050820]|uniref:hypothetical protein n=1 Tax=Kribbella sp. NPDC050820 TaxID=3155408 RepID=UPI0033DC3980
MAKAVSGQADFWFVGGVIDGLVLFAAPRSGYQERVLVPLDVPGLCFVPAAELGERTTDKDLVPGFLDLTKDRAGEAVQASAHGPILYIHMEFHGGEGTHDAVGWQDGEVAFGPLFTRTPREQAPDHYAAVRSGRDMAINAGLRWLGVTAAGLADEYATVGLDRYRWNSEWLASAR